MDILMYLMDTLVFISIFALLSMSLNVEYGYTGLVNFGKVAFFMAGAYTYAITISLGLPFYISLIMAALIPALIGGLVSLPALRLREDYLAIVTLAIGEILRIFVKAEQWLTGGVWGIAIPSIFGGLGLSIEMMALANVLFSWGIVIIIFVLLRLIINTPYGRVLLSIREDDIAVKTLGKNPILYKAQAFMLGSAIAGIAGGFFAQYIRYIDPYMFLPLLTFTVWVMLILGGTANHWGAVAGAMIVEMFNRGSRIAKDYLVLPFDPHNVQFILFGILIILFLLYRPYGLFREKPLKTGAEVEILKWQSSSSTK
ncbi:branched-chain amino acid ABC transporter permease [Peptococcaceae bacterium]|nr:branched-chain amino acid ABC transporter permease [Peptococcaceae bacterium]